MKGEVFKKTFSVIRASFSKRDEVEPDETIIIKEPCALKLPVFIDTLSTDILKNDAYSFLFGFAKLITTDVALTLYRCGDPIADLDDNTYGTFHALGFQDDGKKQYIGYELNWKLVYEAFGEAEYYVKATPTLIFGDGNEENSFTFCLSQYSASKANGTIRLDFKHNGIIGDYLVDTDTKSFKGLNWSNQLRIPKSIILSEKTPFEITKNQYYNGQKKNVKAEQSPEYLMLIKSLPYLLHKYIRVEVLTADEILLTEYNTLSVIEDLVLKNVTFKGGSYDPEFKPGKNKNSNVTITFEQGINNLRKRYS